MALLWAAPALGQGLWNERNEIVDGLAARYAESPTAMGLSSTGGVIELFTSADGDTWTMVLTMPNGVSRIVAHGEAWTDVPRVKRIKGRAM